MSNVSDGDLMIKAHDLIRELDQALRGLPTHDGLLEEDMELLNELKSRGEQLMMEED